MGGTQPLRHIFDVPVKVCMKMVEESCLPNFLQSGHYQYVLDLKSKELVIPTMDYFKITRTLGEGAFGQVLEVIKRDCGKRYAMKVMQKKQLIEAYGEDDWEKLVLVERTLLASLHHPLLINLAYAFQVGESGHASSPALLPAYSPPFSSPRQNIDYLIFITDVSYGGDLEDYGAVGEASERLTTAQVASHAVYISPVQPPLHLP